MILHKNIALVHLGADKKLTSTARERVFLIAEQILEDVISSDVHKSEYWFVGGTRKNDKGDFEAIGGNLMKSFLHEILQTFVKEFLVDVKGYAPTWVDMLIKEIIDNVHTEQDIINENHEYIGSQQSESNIDVILNDVLKDIFRRSKVRLFTSTEHVYRIKNLLEDKWSNSVASRKLAFKDVEFNSELKYFDVEWRNWIEHGRDLLNELMGVVILPMGKEIYKKVSEIRLR
jgi:hypothetical protein